MQRSTTFCRSFPSSFQDLHLSRGRLFLTARVYFIPALLLLLVFLLLLLLLRSAAPLKVTALRQCASVRWRATSRRHPNRGREERKDQHVGVAAPGRRGTKRVRVHACACAREKQKSSGAVFLLLAGPPSTFATPKFHFPQGLFSSFLMRHDLNTRLLIEF